VPVGFGQRLPPADLTLVADFFTALAAAHCDFTDAFVALTDFVDALEKHIQGNNFRRRLLEFV
jgi:hypothetical protein